MNLPEADRAALRRFLQGGLRPLRVEGNPMAEALRMTLLAVDEQAGRVRLSFEPADHFVQGTGVLQGGAVAGMLDFAMAFATLATLDDGQTCATVNLAVSLVRAAPSGRYEAQGEVEQRGRSMAFARASLYTPQPESLLVATATSVLVLRS